MKTHHAAWLSHHTDRTADWLMDRIADGFDIHHLDGDHANNDPLNLVLMESGDHMRMHGMTGKRVTRVVGKGGGRPKGAVGPNGLICYTKRKQGLSWQEVADELGILPRSALKNAKAYALANLKPWPIRPSIDPKLVAAIAEIPVRVVQDNSEYAGILKRFHHLPIERARVAQWAHDTTIRNPSKKAG
jgi:uncharacterized protein (DUF433 family)